MTSHSSPAPAEAHPARPRVLLVDDEPAVLDGLRRQLRLSFEVSTAVGGAEALALLETSEPFAAVLSDMRMPVMDGATFLSLVRERHPDTVRLLLTGQSDMESTIAAINDGQIYQFLSKPCPASTIEAALQDAAKLHRQISAERGALRILQVAQQAPVEGSSLLAAEGASSGIDQPRSLDPAASTPRTLGDRLASIRSMTSPSGADGDEQRVRPWETAPSRAGQISG